MIEAIIKSFMFWKYRWVTYKLSDGSVLCGVETHETIGNMKEKLEA